MHARHLVFAMLPFTATCCPPDAVKPSTSPHGNGGGSAIGTPPTREVTDLGGLTEGAHVHGFTATTLYLDGADQPVGARLVHDGTKFTLDYLRIETAPQGFIWVTTFPTGDQGEPHTQEHLLLGKGDRGRKLGSSETMALAESSAFTAQWRTAYHFNTVAGHDVFWPVFENHLDALLNPDYTDEEIRREVRNFGVDKGDDGKLHLEEKGTVYNEMVRTYEDPDVGMWRAMGQLIYGPKHPLALDSGGHPDAIRTMTPQDIRAFHKSTYHLANMGMIAAFPSSMKLLDVLDHTNAVLSAAKSGTGDGGKGQKVSTEADLPKPSPAAAGTLRVVDYPYADATNPGPMMFGWPATRKLDDTERLLLGLFLGAFAGDESTTLYKKLIDSKTRVSDFGANAVWGYASDDEGQPIYIGLSGCKPDMLDEHTLGTVRSLISAELARIAKLPDGDAELVALNARIASRVVDLRRRYNKFLDSPPGFGYRGTSSGWMDHLQSLSRTGGFKKSLTMRPALATIDQVLAAGGNPWRDRLRSWGLLETVPFGVSSRPSPDYRKKLDADHKARVDAELARLQAQYGTKDAATTLVRYQQDYDTETKKLDAAAAAIPLPELVTSLPMTLDDGLSYTTGQAGANGTIGTFVATFDSMASSRVALSFRVGGAIAPDDGMYLAALPSLMSGAGVVVDGKPIAADAMREQIRKEILELSVYYSDNDRTGRAELVVAGAGNGSDETIKALEWMRRVMFSPDWRIDNLPRLRDLVDQRITGMRQRMLGAEEGWVDDPRDAWRQQKRVQAHTASFLTQLHDLHRLRWQLLDPQDKQVTDEIVKLLGLLGETSKLPRGQLQTLAKNLAALDHPDQRVTFAGAAKVDAAVQKLSAKARPLAIAAGKDLASLLADLPDNSLAADWRYLTKQMAHDLQIGAPAALGKLAGIRMALLQPQYARMVEVGSKASQAAIASQVTALLASIVPAQTRTYVEETDKPFRARLAEREPSLKTAADPLYVGLFAPGTSSGVHLHSSPATWYGDTSDDAVIDYLASNLYTGHGGHSMFMKTWAAGLAYSNGLRPNINDGVLVYYAERTPLLPQTMRFVIDQLSKATPDANIARYAVATAFYSRVAGSYESRAAAMAANLADGQTPDLVRAFRQRVLEIAKRPNLAETLFTRMKTTYGHVLPGYGPPNPKTTYFVIGPEKQLAAWEDYLHVAVGKTTKLYRLYPRDFWLPAKL